MQRIIKFSCTLSYIFLTLNSYASAIFGSSFAEEAILPPHEAFTISSPSLHTVKIKLAPGIYLYDDMTAVLTLDEKSIPEISRPQPKIHNDPYFGPRKIHRGIFIIKLENPPSAAILHYQGCADAGFCYPPMQTELSFSR